MYPGIYFVSFCFVVLTCGLYIFDQNLQSIIFFLSNKHNHGIEIVYQVKLGEPRKILSRKHLNNILKGTCGEGTNKICWPRTGSESKMRTVAKILFLRRVGFPLLFFGGGIIKSKKSFQNTFSQYLKCILESRFSVKLVTTQKLFIWTLTASKNEEENNYGN